MAIRTGLLAEIVVHGARHAPRQQAALVPDDPRRRHRRDVDRRHDLAGARVRRPAGVAGAPAGLQHGASSTKFSLAELRERARASSTCSSGRTSPRAGCRWPSRTSRRRPASIGMQRGRRARGASSTRLTYRQHLPRRAMPVVGATANFARDQLHRARRGAGVHGLRGRTPAPRRDAGLRAGAARCSPGRDPIGKAIRIGRERLHRRRRVRAAARACSVPQRQRVRRHSRWHVLREASSRRPASAASCCASW